MTTPTPKGLGKGLSALMGEDYSQTMANDPDALNSRSQSSNTLPVDAIHSGSFQPRTRFTEEYLQELAESIRKNGVMQPIIVRPSASQEGKYEIIAGERRWRASKLAGLTKIPVILREIGDELALELALVENVQRQDLTPLEEATGYQRLMDEFGYTQEQLSKTIGKSRSHIANLLRLLSLPEEIKGFLDAGKLTMGHARALLTADNAIQLAEKILREDLNVRQTEELVRGGAVETARSSNNQKASGGSSAQTSGKKDPDIIALEETLSAGIGLAVSINAKGGQKGEVVIQYSTLSQLDDILRRLGDGI